MVVGKRASLWVGVRALILGLVAVSNAHGLPTAVPGLSEVLRYHDLFEGEKRPFLNYDVYSNHVFAPWDAVFGNKVDWARPRISEVGDGTISMPAVSFLNTVNTGYEYGNNDRSFWQGRGINGLAVASAAAKWGALEVTVAPEFWYTQNAHYRIREAQSGDPNYGNYGTRIDAPQRFGNDPIVSLHPGQSSLRMVFPYFTAGISTENIKLGPGVRNSIVLSNNAPGFPHIDLGTFRPVETRIGYLETRLFWGRLKESDYYDDIPDNDHRLIVGGAFAYSPSFLPSLTLGVNRVIVSPWETADAYKVFQLFEAFLKDNRDRYDDTRPDDDADQVISVYLEWLLRESGFRAYLEFARNDHAGHAWDLYMNPEHSRAYTAGVEQRIPGPNAGSFLLQGEVTVMNRSPTYAVRPTAPWYRHGPVEQGYTNQGQSLGTYFGSGGNSQYLGLKWFHDRGMLGGFYERTVFDNDFFYSLPDRDYLDFYVESVLGVEAYFDTGPIDLFGGLSTVFSSNRWWIDQYAPASFRLEVGLTRRF